MFSAKLRAELSRLTAERRVGAAAAGAGAFEAREHRTPAGVDEYLPGGEAQTECGPVFVHECLLSGFKDNAASLRDGYAGIENGTLESSWELGGALLSELRGTARKALFLDLETTGLHGSTLFLAGFMTPVQGDFVVRQLFARDYSEEKALLHEAKRALESCDMLVSFNGKSYDVPFMKERAAYHRLDLSCVNDKPHLDLLHWSRKKWKGSVTDCRLKTLEWEICRQRRWGDVPGDQIPGIYHRFVRTGDPYQLVPVFHHNVLDLVTMVDLIDNLLGRP